MPTAPENFDKVSPDRDFLIQHKSYPLLKHQVISGEIKGKELIKMNQKAFDDYNETALESCQWCGR